MLAPGDVHGHMPASRRRRGEPERAGHHVAGEHLAPVVVRHHRVIKGLAREVAVLNKLEVCQPEIIPVAATITDKKGITLSAPAACPR